MKKRIAILIVAGVLGMTGCSKKQNENVPGTDDFPGQVLQEEEAQEEEMKDDGEEEKVNHTAEIPAGVFLNGGDLVSVPMGTYYNGEVRDFCRVLLPETYVFGSIYTDENGEEQSNRDVASYLKDEKDIDSYPSSSWIDSRSPYEDGTVIMIMLITRDLQSMDELLEYAYNEVFIDEQAFYFVDEDPYVTADLNMCRAINEDLFISISYEGPLAEELGLKQLAQNLYDLVEITE